MLFFELSSGVQGSLNDFNATADYPPPNSGVVCGCTNYASDPCMGEFSTASCSAELEASLMTLLLLKIITPP